MYFTKISTVGFVVKLLGGLNGAGGWGVDGLVEVNEMRSSPRNHSRVSVGY